ncbi:MAG: 3-phosphoshikimate 1-carboxyvinyltransferase [Bdellovibrionales bacterium]
MTKLVSKKSAPLNGITKIPGDKSISHRALMLGAIAKGETIISGLLEGEDVLATGEAMRQLGAKVHDGDDGLWRVEGVGLGNLTEPRNVLDMGNSGTSTRLLMGLMGGHPIAATLTGDNSLIKRPMGRVVRPLEQMGISFLGRAENRLPLTLKGPQSLKPITYHLPIASAQVKSAILLAGLTAKGTTIVIEDTPTRDHTENMLRAFGVTVDVETGEDGETIISLKGGQTLQPCAIDVPGDPSSAAFPAVAAILREGSDVTLKNICINETRIGLYTTLIEMGANIEFINKRTQGGEPVADLHIKGTGPLTGIDVDPARVPSMIDEFPALAMAAACATGTTRMTDLGELRVKESDRLLMVAQGLKACGVALEMGEDSLTVNSNGHPPIGGGAFIKTELDHRIAMAFLVLGTVTDEPVTIDDATPIKTSFPDFVELMNDLGCDIETKT